MGSDRKALDGDLTDAPTAIHAKQPSPQRARSATSRDDPPQVEGEPPQPALEQPGAAAIATLDEMVQLLRAGLTSDPPDPLQEAELVVRSSLRRAVSEPPTAATSAAPDPPSPRSRYACLPPPSDPNAAFGHPFDSEAPTAAMPPIPRAPRIPEVEGVRLWAPTISSNPPSDEEPTWPPQRWPRPLRLAALLLLCAAGFVLAALVILFW